MTHEIFTTEVQVYNHILNATSLKFTSEDDGVIGLKTVGDKPILISMEDPQEFFNIVWEAIRMFKSVKVG